MRLSGSKLAASLLLITISPTGSASSVWEWSYSGSGIAASGIFITVDTPDANGGYLITAITGTRNGESITALQPAGKPIPGNEPYTVDNLIFESTGAQLTAHGFGFATSDGNYSNPFYADFLPTPGYLEFYSMPASRSSTELPVVFTANLVSTLEPGTCSLAFLALALCAFGLAQTKKARSHQAIRHC